MVSIDDRLYDTLTAAARHGWGGWGGWRRWLVLPVALPLFLAGGLAFGILVNLAVNGGFADEGAGLLAPGSAVAADGGSAASGGACERIEYIVGTACSLKQRDRDAWEIRQCVAHELKYTMWSAYGCK